MTPRFLLIGLCALGSAGLLWHDLGRHAPPAPIVIPRSPRLPGLTLVPVGAPGRRPRGLMVTSLGSRAISAGGGIRVGDLIDSVDGHPVATIADLDRVLASDREPRVRLHLRRGPAAFDRIVDRRDEARR